MRTGALPLRIQSIAGRSFAGRSFAGRSFNEGRGVHARRHVRRPGRVVRQRMGHTLRRERS